MSHRRSRRERRNQHREQMAQRREERRDAHRRHRERKPRKRRERTPEELAYRAARARANRKASFAIHLVTYAAVLFTILVTTRSLRVVLIVAASWGIGLAIHYFAALVLPGLRQRWIDQEVGREVRPVVHRERRALEQGHERSLEELSASIAHEIRNPITAAKSLVQQMGEDPQSRENVDYADVALAELDRVERSISHLLRYARDEELRVVDVDVSDLCASALATFRDRMQRAGVDASCDLADAGFVQGDAEKLRRVVINLVGNSLDALEQSDTSDACIEVAAGENLAGTKVWVRVRDNGPGIEPTLAAKIFDPFYTTRDGGTGLGLAVSKKVVDAHGGSIEVDSEPGRGTAFVLTLPKLFEAGEGGAR